jgi:hypothetical protein
MNMQGAGAVAVYLMAVAAISPAAGQQRLDLSLGFSPLESLSRAASRGLDQHAQSFGTNPTFFSTPAPRPPVPQDGVEVPSKVLGLDGTSDVRVSLGQVGIDSRSAGSYKPERGSDPYYFNIPSQRPAQTAPGVIFKIPFGTETTR